VTANVVAVKFEIVAALLENSTKEAVVLCVVSLDAVLVSVTCGRLPAFTVVRVDPVVVDRRHDNDCVALALEKDKVAVSLLLKKVSEMVSRTGETVKRVPLCASADATR
jgi:hypothetical protein